MSQKFALSLAALFIVLWPTGRYLSDILVSHETLDMAHGALAAYLVLIAVASFSGPARRYPNLFAIFALISSEVSLLVLTVLTGGSMSPYNEPFVGYVFLAPLAPWRMKYLISSVLFSMSLYPFATLAAGAMGPFDAWLIRLASIIIVCGISLVSAFFQSRLRRKAFYDRVQIAQNANDLRSALTVLRDQQRSVSADLHQARTFQQKMLRPLPESKDIKFAALYTPPEFLGGDFYEVTQLGPHWYRLFLLDVTGHGAQAAMRTMIL